MTEDETSSARRAKALIFTGASGSSPPLAVFSVQSWLGGLAQLVLVTMQTRVRARRVLKGALMCRSAGDDCVLLIGTLRSDGLS
jgi:hypothetical protein